VPSRRSTSCRSVGRTSSRCASSHRVSRRDYSSSGLHQLYYAYVVHPDAPSRRSTSSQSVALARTVCPVIPLCVVTIRLAAATDILRLRRASGCLGTSRGSSRGSSRRSSSITPPHAGSSSITSPLPRVRVPRHIARLIAPLVVDYSASRRLVVDYFPSATRPGASARRAAHHAARRGARRRILRLVRARRRQLHLAQVRRRLLRLRCPSGCLGTSRGSSHGSSHRSSSNTPPCAGS
jgi:hypothetical protein